MYITPVCVHLCCIPGTKRGDKWVLFENIDIIGSDNVSLITCSEMCVHRVEELLTGTCDFLHLLVQFRGSV